MPDPTPSAPTIVDAILYLPAVGSEALSVHRVASIAPRLAQAMERVCGRAEARFVVGESSQVTYGADRKATRVSIRRIERVGERGMTGGGVDGGGGGGEREVARIDLYEISHTDYLTDGLVEASVVRKAFQVTRVFLLGGVRFVGLAARRARGKQGIGRGQAMQLTWGVGLLALLAVSWLMLLPGVLDALWRVVQSLRGTAVEGFAGALGLKGWMASAWTSLAAAVAGVAGVTLLLPRKVRELVESGAVDLIRLTNYFEHGEGRGVMVAQLPAFLDSLAERGQRYRRVHVMGYSFGSIVALDALFPVGQPASARLARIDSLITIACPFDIVRAYWPGHYSLPRGARAEIAPGAEAPGRPEGRGPSGWWNVLSPGDPLSSNFRNDSDPDGAPEVGPRTAATTPLLPTRNLCYRNGPGGHPVGLLGALLVRGLRNHGRFWDSEHVDADSCFDLVLQTAYAGDALLE
ncbi:MAG: hypothetical protein JNM80_01845 [Phycisphaerae bacterium]|nr:hypothetical protein [Phycisphaerae bacterium]